MHGKIKCVSMALTSALVLFIASPAYARKGGLIRWIFEDHPIFGYVLLGIVLLVVAAVVVSMIKGGQKIKEAEEKLLKFAGLMRMKKFDQAKALCKECFVEDWTGVYRGDHVRHNSKVLERLIESIKTSGQPVPPALEELAKAFKAQVAKGKEAKVDVMDAHDQVLALIQQV